jgi:hypothetical protein
MNTATIADSRGASVSPLARPQRLRSGREAASGCLSQDHERVLAQSEEAQNGENNNDNENDPKNRHGSLLYLSTCGTVPHVLRLRATFRWSPPRVYRAQLQYHGLSQTPTNSRSLSRTLRDER